MVEYHGRLPWQFHLAESTVSNIINVRKFGQNPSPAIDVEADVWDAGGTYSYLSSAAPLYLNAALAAVTGLTFEVQGLNSSWDLQTSSGTLSTVNGRTQAVVGSTAITWMRVHRLRNTSSVNSSSAVFLAISTAVSTATGSPAAAAIKAKVQANRNQSMMAMYSMPRGYFGQITSLRGSVSRDSTGGTGVRESHLSVYVREFGQSFNIKDLTNLSLSAGGRDIVYDQWERIKPKSDIVLRCQPHQADCSVFAGFSLFGIKTTATT